MECRLCNYFAYYTLAFAFKLVENSRENTPEKVVEKCQLARFIMSRGLMWSANNGTPKSSRICLLLAYQGLMVAKERHLD
jgi:hypothetical protein